MVETFSNDGRNRFPKESFELWFTREKELGK
jgi:hypothetical protein